MAGRSQGDAECRGRWRDTQRISDRYTSITLPIVDASVAACLSIGGPVNYEPKEGSMVTDEWLVRRFVPHLAEKLGNRTAVVLGKALLWCLMEPMTCHMIPQTLRASLQEKYTVIQTLDEVINPIEKILLSVYSPNGQLQIDPLAVRDRGGGGQWRTTSRRTARSTVTTASNESTNRGAFCFTKESK